MGLDMYLLRKTYVKNWDHYPPEQRTTVAVTLGGKPHPGIDPSKVRYIEEEVAYWRKANEVHQWFVENAQDGTDDCGEHYVSREQIAELVETCRRVLADHSLAAEELPTQAGFFFGGTDYDEWYFKDLESTIEQLTPILASTDTSGDYYYHSSW